MQAILIAGLLQLFFIKIAIGFLCQGTAKACSSPGIIGQNYLTPPVIFPEGEDYIINATQSFTLRCSGKNFVTWTPPDNTVSASTEDVFPKYSNITIKSSEELDKEYRYESVLTITNASYQDVGYYYCHENTTDFNDLSRVSMIYMYVNDTTELSTLSELPLWLSVLENSEAVVPCRPTSPDVKVELRLTTGEEVPLDKEDELGTSVTYDPKKGYTISKLTTVNFNIYQCIFSRGNDDQYVTTSADFHYFPTPTPKPLLKEISGGHTIVGQKLILKCTVRYDERFRMGWIVPNKNGKHVISKIRQLTNVKRDNYLYFQHLEIQNTTMADQGEYTCIVKTAFGKNDDTKLINIYDRMEHFINLTVENGIYNKSTKAGDLSVQWHINVNAHLTPKLIWYDNKNNEIEPGLKTNDNTSKYIIEIESGKAAFLKINDITLFDWGYYKLKAINDFEEKTIKLFLNVTDKPSVDIQMKLFYHIHESNIIRCKVAAYPEATINWFYKPCLDRGCNYTHLVSDRVVATGPLQTAYLNFTANHTGHVLCTANNSLGRDEVSKRLFVTDVKNGFGIWGLDKDTIETKNKVSRYPIAVGDDVTIYCTASHYNYTNDLKWYKQVNGDTIVLEKDDHYDIEKGSTEHSNEVALIILNVSYNDSGKYLCVVENKTNLDVRINYTVTITVRDSEKPSFILTNLNNTDLVTMSPTRLEMTCMARGIPKPTITWYKNGEKMLASRPKDRIELVHNNQDLIFKYTDFEDEGTYTCKATNKIGSDQRETQLKFKNKPGFNYIYIIIIVVLTLLFIIVLILVLFKFMKKGYLLRKVRTDDGTDEPPMAELSLN